MSIDVLIGENCAKALEPIDFIASKNGGPYALETVLEWCVAGPIGRSCKGNDIISYSRIAVQDAGTKQISSYHFEIQKEVKDTGISNMMQGMYQLDFIESRTKFKGLMTNRLDVISYEDNKSLKIMEDQVVKVRNHYETRLPLRNPEMTLPNNTVIAEKRANYLKRKFQKDEQHFSHYEDFMNEINEKGYARVSDRTPVDGKLWYLPHHGVYHPAKPNKIRVVFDYSAEYAGRCINKGLLVGPDLTNQIIGILIRLRQGRVAFVADIEKFFQVLVSKEHRSLFRFLLWQDGKKLIDHEMSVHVFGGTSSPSCSNYVLKRTSIDGEDQFGKAAAKTLQDNFSVDDLLKSLDNERKLSNS